LPSRHAEGEGLEVGRTVLGRIGIRHVVGEHLLALPEPLEPLLHDPERREIRRIHGNAPRTIQTVVDDIMRPPRIEPLSPHRTDMARAIRVTSL
jgi:hypothetical protein